MNGEGGTVMTQVRFVRFFLQPPDPEGFNPLTATPEELERYGIPPKPDPDRQPALTRFWTEMYSPPLVFVAPPIEVPGTSDFKTESSLNWSGAYITPRNGQQFTEVHAAWEIPHVTVPAGGSESAEYRSSCWIGVDGSKSYFDSSLPQLGTGQFVKNDPAAAPYYHTWCQWWLRDNPQTFIPLTLSVRIAPGQRVMASLRFWSKTEMHGIIVNRTTGEILPFIMEAPTDTASNMKLKVSGATAEWIVERPADEKNEPYALPDYGTVRFTNCCAVSAEMSVEGVPGPGREWTLDGARLIRMYKHACNPSRTVMISKAERQDADRFTTLYVR
jgi:peptidase A4-like protein